MVVSVCFTSRHFPVMLQFLPILMPLGSFYLLFCKKMLSVYQKLYISPLLPPVLNIVFKQFLYVISWAARLKEVFFCPSPLFLVVFCVPFFYFSIILSDLSQYLFLFLATASSSFSSPVHLHTFALENPFHMHLTFFFLSEVSSFLVMDWNLFSL